MKILFSIFAIVFWTNSVGAVTEADCKEHIAAFQKIRKSINVTDRFFRAPEEYKAYADKCDEIIKCGKALDAVKAEEMIEKMGFCSFHTYYNREFSTCANKLIAKKDDKIPCLDTLFNDIHEPEVDECVQWDSLQPCIKEQIGKLCDDKDGKIQKEYVKQAAKLRPEFCD